MSYLFLVGYFVNALFASTNWRLSPHMVLIVYIVCLVFEIWFEMCCNRGARETVGFIVGWVGHLQFFGNEITISGVTFCFSLKPF